jgi:predicted PurR-regulated permease PerM
MTDKRFYFIILSFLVLALGYLSYLILKPFLSSIMWAIVFSIVFYPLYAFILRRLKWKHLASLITLIIILLLILGPFSYLSFILTQEIVAMMGKIEQGTLDPMGTIMQHPYINDMLSKMLSFFNVSEGQFQKVLIDMISQIGKASTGFIKSGLGNIASAAIDFIFMILSIFFLLEDGPRFVEKVGDYMPFSKKQKEKILTQTKGIVVSTIYGGVTVAVVQGIIGGFAFAILKVPSPVVWGTAMFIASFIPLVGTFVVWGPAVLYLLLQGHLWKGIILMLIGVFGISAADNVLRPLIIRGKMQMPILAIFFSILGGIKLFGFIGFIMGPLVLALFVSVFEIFRYTEEELMERHGK